MPLLTIKQTTGLAAKVELDGGEWEVQFEDPFTPEQEEDLRWYFERLIPVPIPPGSNCQTPDELTVCELLRNRVRWQG